MTHLKNVTYYPALKLQLLQSFDHISGLPTYNCSILWSWDHVLWLFFPFYGKNILYDHVTWLIDNVSCLTILVICLITAIKNGCEIKSGHVNHNDIILNSRLNCDNQPKTTCRCKKKNIKEIILANRLKSSSLEGSGKLAFKENNLL